MAEADTHPTAGRRRRDKGPPSMPTLPRLDRVSDTEGEHSDDSAGEKEAKRQRSEPTTPVSTSGRLPYDYDAVMGITKVGTKEVEGFGEDLDTSEYHDAAEEPSRKDESDNTVEPQRLSDFQGGYGSSSLKECIELLNTTTRIAPAPLDSGDGQNPAAPPHILREILEELIFVSLHIFVDIADFWGCGSGKNGGGVRAGGGGLVFIEKKKKGGGI